jgi:hypothetical protein
MAPMLQVHYNLCFRRCPSQQDVEQAIKLKDRKMKWKCGCDCPVIEVEAGKSENWQTLQRLSCFQITNHSYGDVEFDDWLIVHNILLVLYLLTVSLFELN